MSKIHNKEALPRLRFPEYVKFGRWTERMFKDMFEIGSGRDYKHLNKGEIPVFGSGGYMLSVDDFLYDGESACIGRKGTIDNPIFLTGKFWTVDTLFYTHSFKECLPKFVFYIFQGIEWRKHNEAGGIPSLSKDIISKIKTFSPPKIDEQKKITDCLSSLDDLITAQNDKINALKNYKKGLMQQLFPQDGETVPRLRFPEFRNSGVWEIKTLGDVCQMQAGKFVPASEIFPTPANNLFPCFGGNGQRGYTNTFTHDGSYSLIGRQGALCGNVTFVHGRFHATEHAVVVTPEQNVSNDWLYFTLGFLNLNQYATGQAQPGLSVERLTALKLMIPNDISEQQKIAESFSALGDIIAAQVASVEYLKSHKRGLLQQLFPSLAEGE